MRLLNTTTLEFEEFQQDIPRYAILSHRWEDKEEVSFENIHHEPNHLKGYHKIRRFCQVAHERGHKFAWVDTCCIDKKSSAELSEAINSMYKWYQRAAECYAYLSDVGDMDDLPNSVWFTRGWTLQELLAPNDLQFFNKDWSLIASRKDIAPKLEHITGIPQAALHKFRAEEFCIARRMSWAARRTTTREEDRAYSLLGIFNVNMPLLYGEGQKAFQRLQEEIMRMSIDMSLFLWQGPPCVDFGVLAADPSCFLDVPERLKDPRVQGVLDLSTGWDVNNAGIRLQASIIPYALTSDRAEIYLLYLHEPRTFQNSIGLGIFIEREYRNRENSPFRRVAVNGRTWCEAEWSRSNYMHVDPEVSQLLIARKPLNEHQLHGDWDFDVSFNPTIPCKCIARQRPHVNQDGDFQEWPVVRETSTGNLHCSFVVEATNVNGMLGHLIITTEHGVETFIGLGFDRWFRPLCIIIPFCKQLYLQGLRYSNIKRAYYQLPLPFAGQDRVATDPASHVTLVSGSEGALEYCTDNADLEVYIEDGTNGKYTASIYFDATAFLSQYLPELGPEEYLMSGKLPEAWTRQLSRMESSLVAAQRHLFVLPQAELASSNVTSVNDVSGLLF